MSRHKKYLLLIICYPAFFAFWILAGSLAGTFCLADADTQPAPAIVIEPKDFDFGVVDGGAIVKHDFTVANMGGAVLILRSAYASCGCTTPKLSKSKLAPGESATLTVAVDTSMKQNRITKTVYIDNNDPLKPLATVDLIMNVVNPHKVMSEADQAKIFSDERCASCHVARGINKFGRDLYNADCAMCHGPKAEGAVGPALFGPYENPAFAQAMTQTASFGSKTHRSMPGFLIEAGGPLSKKQIDSVMAYLADLSHKRKYPTAR